MSRNCSLIHSTNTAKGITDNIDTNKDIVRILGTYSLLEFFEQEVQKEFFKKITSREFESTFDPDNNYAKDHDPFLFSGEERRFELQMTNMGFIREGFWRDAFPPIFQLKDDHQGEQTWEWMLPECTKEKIACATENQKPDKYAEAHLYQYCLRRLDEELRKVDGEHEIHIGLNRFGIVNIGITIKWGKRDLTENQSFEDLCKDAYKKVIHLQEDPLKDFEVGKQLTVAEKAVQGQVLSALTNRDSPRLVVSYFQVLAITTIHRFLHDKLTDGAIRGFEKKCLTNPWELAIKIEESTRKGLPPLRHVVFMYQLVHSISYKTLFLKRNRRALLTLGHNVGWHPSDEPPFPAFDSEAPLKDSSLLETSCCLIFPQGLVVVIPPQESSVDVQTVYPGGMRGNPSSPWVLYRDYWKLIFKLFIRVAEARLLIGMVNRELSDIHKDFLKNRQARWRFWQISNIHSRLMRVGSIIQRTSGRVITPEVTRYSFVRKKLIDFLKSVNFEEHRDSIQTEFKTLNEWIITVRTNFAAYVAIVIALLSFLVAVIIGVIQVDQNSSAKESPTCPIQEVSNRVNDLRVDMDKLKNSTAAVTSELDTLQAKIGPVGKDLETVKRCLRHNQKDTTSEKRTPSSSAR